jgi:2-methylisocitrate lyase-like PEP mutase family enzyme
LPHFVEHDVMEGRNRTAQASGAGGIFRKLHAGPGVLVLPNAWDAGSARVIESAGAKAIATTSAGVAWSRGYPDGDALPVELLLAAAREIVRAVRVPVSMDIEGGYSPDPAAVADVVARVVDAGVAGINIEDGAGTPELLAPKIEAARARAQRAGVDLFINARCDVYLRGIAEDDPVGEVVRRATLYRRAGCDGLFVPGLADASEIAAVASAVDLPLNVMLLPDLPPLDVLAARGVRRLSAGSAIAEAALGRTRDLAARLLAGDASAMFEQTTDYGTMNELLAER